jgi:glutaredoxin
VPVEVVLYSRQQCHLCHIAKTVIEAAQRRFKLDIQLVEIDIDQVPELREKFDLFVPVVSIAGREVFEYRFDQESFRAAVERQMKGTTP